MPTRTMNSAKTSIAINIAVRRDTMMPLFEHHPNPVRQAPRLTPSLRTLRQRVKLLNTHRIEYVHVVAVVFILVFPSPGAEQDSALEHRIMGERVFNRRQKAELDALRFRRREFDA